MREAPCVHMGAAYARKRSLCDQLEAIADSLPYRVDRLECVRVANVLLPLLRESHRYEEQVLFPAFERGMLAPATSGETVRRLKSEHVYDECAAEEITEQLMWIGRGGEIANPEALGFMLRAFFDPVRRHIAFERDYMIPAAGVAEPASAAGDGL
jgi:hypothetical protein